MNPGSLPSPGAGVPGLIPGTTGLAYAGIGLFVLLGIYAVLLLNAERLPAWLRLPSPTGLKPRLTIALLLVATLPAISLALVLSERASRQRIERVAASLQIETDRTARTLDFLLETTRAGVVALAQHIERAGALTPDAALHQLQLHHVAAPGMESMLLVDREGAVVAATVRTKTGPVPFPEPTRGSDENSFISTAMHSELPRVSGAEREPLFRRHPAILISAPVRTRDGLLWGAVVGALDPESLTKLQGDSAKDQAGEGLLIVDNSYGIVLISQPAGSEGQPGALRDAALRAAGTGDQPFLFTASAADGPREEFISTATMAGNGWRVLRFMPTVALRAASRQEYGVALGWLIAAMIVSVCLSIALAASISQPLSKLDSAVRQFDPEFDRELPGPPPNAPREVVVLFGHLSSVTERLRASYEQLRHSLRQGERLRRELIEVIERREQEIEGRTEQLKQANAELDRLSRSDPLTGIANRRAFSEFLERAWRTALREQHPISLLMIDIDCFKAYNDAYGHQRGDTCLKAVAEAICQVAARAGDLVSRYGGEEFVVVLSNTPLEGALQVAEQIRAAIQGLAIPHRGSPLAGVVTVSVGATSTLPTRNVKPDVCLAAADRALYAAKEQGRNRVGYSTAAQTGLFQSLCLPNDPAPRPS